jgi:hypothetical protein
MATLEQQEKYQEFLAVAEQKKYKAGWAYYRMADTFGREVADDVCKKQAKPEVIATPKPESVTAKSLKRNDQITLPNGEVYIVEKISSYGNTHQTGMFCKFGETVYRHMTIDMEGAEVCYATSETIKPETSAKHKVNNIVKSFGYDTNEDEPIAEPPYNAERAAKCVCDWYDLQEDGCQCGAAFNDAMPELYAKWRPSKKARVVAPYTSKLGGK